MTPLVSREPLQEPCGSPCAFGLERTPDFEGVGAELLHRFAFIGGRKGIDCHTSAAQSDAEDTQGALALRSRGFDLDVQEERAIPALPQRGTGRRLALQAGCLMVARCGGKAFSA
jgi:hypothetical protein